MISLSMQKKKNADRDGLDLPYNPTSRYLFHMSSMRISRAFQAQKSSRHSSPVPIPVDVVNLIVELTEKGTILED